MCIVENVLPMSPNTCKLCPRSIQKEGDSNKNQIKSVYTIKETIKMFQTGLKTDTDKEIKVNLPEEDDFDDNPC